MQTVPLHARVTEQEFWRNYFSHVRAILAPGTIAARAKLRHFAAYAARLIDATAAVSGASSTMNGAAATHSGSVSSIMAASASAQSSGAYPALAQTPPVSASSVNAASAASAARPAQPQQTLQTPQKLATGQAAQTVASGSRPANGHQPSSAAASASGAVVMSPAQRQLHAQQQALSPQQALQHQQPQQQLAAGGKQTAGGAFNNLSLMPVCSPCKQFSSSSTVAGFSLCPIRPSWVERSTKRSSVQQFVGASLVAATFAKSRAVRSASACRDLSCGCPRRTGLLQVQRQHACRRHASHCQLGARAQSINLRAHLPRKQQAKDFAKRHNVPRYYTQAQSLIHDKEVDAVYIATPPGLHWKQASC